MSKIHQITISCSSRKPKLQQFQFFENFQWNRVAPIVAKLPQMNSDICHLLFRRLLFYRTCDGRLGVVVFFVIIGVWKMSKKKVTNWQSNPENLQLVDSVISIRDPNSHFAIREEIAAGAFGVVYKVSNCWFSMWKMCCAVDGGTSRQYTNKRKSFSPSRW